MRDIVSSLDSEVNFGASEGWIGVFCKFHKQTTKDGDCRVMARLRLEAAEVAWGRSSPTHPDWKVCRMRGGSLLRPNCLRGCICVTKQ